MHRIACFHIAMTLGLGACAIHDEPGDSVGHVELTLTGTSSSGVTYRLRNAELTINGGPAPIVFHTEDDPSRTLITQRLDVGAFSLHVTPGWHLERISSAGVAETVEATLISPDPQPFTIVADTLTSVVIRFLTNGEVVDMGHGDVGISIGVDEQFASCAEILAADPSARDGIYSIHRTTGSIQVFCDMTHGGVTYEQAAFGSSFSSYPGYSLITTSELNDPVIQRAFTLLFNLQGSALINIDSTFTSNNCCIKAADSGPGSYLKLGGHYIYPENTDGSIQCNPNYPAPSYRFVFGDNFEVPPSPLPDDFFATHPATTGPACSDGNNPGWFFKRSTAARASFTIGGTVSGLTGTGLVLQDNAGDDLAISADGAFVFSTAVASGETYAVTVKTHPSGQVCTIANGAGRVDASNVTSVQVACHVGWSPSLFPIAVPGTTLGVGDLAFDNHGDLLLTSSPAGAIVRIDQATGAQTMVANGIGTGLLLGIAYRAANDTIYVNDDIGEVFAVTPTGTITLLTTVSGLNALAVAPPSFGSLGDFLIGVTQQGDVVALDPDSGLVSTIGLAGPASDLAFAPDGTLYICGQASVRTVTATGAVAVFASGLSSADGLAIAPDGSRMFIADSGVDTVRQITIPGAVATTLGPADIDSGFFVGGIIAAPGNTLIVMTGETSLTLIALTY